MQPESQPISPLHGKVALITGAGQGVGRGIALALAKAGASLMLAGRNPGKLQQTLELVRGIVGVPAETVVCDVTNAQQIEDCVAACITRFGALHILINHSQIMASRAAADPGQQGLANDICDAGPLAYQHFMQLARPYLRGDGVVINVCVQPMPGSDSAFYAATLSEIQALTLTSAKDWGTDNIRVNCLKVLANTPSTEAHYVAQPEQLANALAAIPLGSFAESEINVGGAVVFLASAAGAMTTGCCLAVDGGLHLV